MADIYNNLVETLIKRFDPLNNHAPAPTIFSLGKIQYVFQPRPELTGDAEASVCVVISQEHRDYLLTDTRCRENFRKYVPKEMAPADVQERAMFAAWMEMRKTMTPEEIKELTMKNAMAETGEQPTDEKTVGEKSTTGAVQGIKGIEGLGKAKDKAKDKAPPSDFAPPETGGSGKLDLASIDI